MYSFLKKIYLKHFLKLFFGKIKNYNRHKSYEDYINKQKEKTNNLEKIAIWKGSEWETKVKGFENLFERNKKFLKNKKKAICLGARTGQEVFVLRKLGLEAIGIDLVPFPPYTIEGDIHNLSFKNEEFDFVFTNIFDHSLYPEKFILEMERVCSQEGHIIINLQINTIGDDYTENYINDPNEVLKMFKKSKLIISRNIENTFDGMNYEFVFKKSIK